MGYDRSGEQASFLEVVCLADPASSSQASPDAMLSAFREAGGIVIRGARSGSGAAGRLVRLCRDQAALRAPEPSVGPAPFTLTVTADVGLVPYARESDPYYATHLLQQGATLLSAVKSLLKFEEGGKTSWTAMTAEIGSAASKNPQERKQLAAAVAHALQQAKKNKQRADLCLSASIPHRSVRATFINSVLSADERHTCFDP